MLQVAGVLQAEEQVVALPDVWELTYRAALNFAKAAAVDELLGNYTASLRAYTKVQPAPLYSPGNATTAPGNLGQGCWQDLLAFGDALGVL